jgi:hypothetical protein
MRLEPSQMQRGWKEKVLQSQIRSATGPHVRSGSLSPFWPSASHFRSTLVNRHRQTARHVSKVPNPDYRRQTKGCPSRVVPQFLAFKAPAGLYAIKGTSEKAEV